MGLAVAIKSIVANQQQPCHAKGRDIVNLCPWWRVTISLNDRSDRMLVLPPLEHEDIAGKIVLLRATAYPMPMATNSVEEKAKFWRTLTDELPAFLHWLTTDFEIPGDWRDSRFGVKAWHSPALLTELEELSPALTLLELIDRLKPWQPANTSWEGTALELRGLLLDAQVTRRDAQETLRWVNACGLYLNELAQMRPERVKARRTTYRRWFEIHAP
jgi:hypothetical protein